MTVPEPTRASRPRPTTWNRVILITVTVSGTYKFHERHTIHPHAFLICDHQRCHDGVRRRNLKPRERLLRPGCRIFFRDPKIDRVNELHWPISSGECGHDDLLTFLLVGLGNAEALSCLWSHSRSWPSFPSLPWRLTWGWWRLPRRRLNRLPICGARRGANSQRKLGRQL